MSQPVRTPVGPEIRADERRPARQLETARGWRPGGPFRPKWREHPAPWGAFKQRHAPLGVL